MLDQIKTAEAALTAAVNATAGELARVATGDLNHALAMLDQAQSDALNRLEEAAGCVRDCLAGMQRRMAEIAASLAGDIGLPKPPAQQTPAPAAPEPVVVVVAAAFEQPAAETEPTPAAPEEQAPPVVRDDSLTPEAKEADAVRQESPAWDTTEAAEEVAAAANAPLGRAKAGKGKKR